MGVNFEDDAVDAAESLIRSVKELVSSPDSLSAIEGKRLHRARVTALSLALAAVVKEYDFEIGPVMRTTASIHRIMCAADDGSAE